MTWRTAKPCADCPFGTTASGIRLWRSLGRARRQEIIAGLRQGNEHFICHKTSYETGDGSNLACAGGIGWQHQRGINSNLERVMGRIEAISARNIAASREREA